MASPSLGGLSRGARAQPPGISFVSHRGSQPASQLVRPSTGQSVSWPVGQLAVHCATQSRRLFRARRDSTTGQPSLSVRRGLAETRLSDANATRQRLRWRKIKRRSELQFAKAQSAPKRPAAGSALIDYRFLGAAFDWARGHLLGPEPGAEQCESIGRARALS